MSAWRWRIISDQGSPRFVQSTELTHLPSDEQALNLHPWSIRMFCRDVRHQRTQRGCIIVNSCPTAQSTYTRFFGLYCSASAKCAAWICSHPAKSAIVRASFSTRWYPRVDKFICPVAARIRLSPASSNLQNSLTSPTRISAFEITLFDFMLANRSRCFCRAPSTLSRIHSDDSPKRSLLNF
jgi:hypothetical protein